jgi:hypothetical protein
MLLPLIFLTYMNEEQTTFFKNMDAAFAQLDLSDMPEEFQEEYLVIFGDMVVQAVLQQTIPLLDDASQNHIDVLLEQEDDNNLEEVFNLLEKNVPNFSTIVAEEASRIQKEIADQEKKAA